MSMHQILELLTQAEEFAELPVRHNEDELNEAFAKVREWATYVLWLSIRPDVFFVHTVGMSASTRVSKLGFTARKGFSTSTSSFWEASSPHRRLHHRHKVRIGSMHSSFASHD